MRTGSENNESIFWLFIPVAGYFAIFGNPADGAVYLDFLYNGESEKTISCWADQSDGIIITWDWRANIFQKNFCKYCPPFLMFLRNGREDSSINKKWEGIN